MNNDIWLYNRQIDATVSANTEASSYDVENILDNCPDSTYRSTGTTATIQLTYSTSIDFSGIFIGNHNIQDGATIDLKLYSDAFLTLTETIDLEPGWVDMTGYYNLQATFTQRSCAYIELVVTVPSGYVEIGILYIGDAYTCVRNADFGIQRISKTELKKEYKKGNIIKSGGNVISENFKMNYSATSEAQMEIFKDFVTNQDDLVYISGDDCYYGGTILTRLDWKQNYEGYYFPFEFQEAGIYISHIGYEVKITWTGGQEIHNKYEGAKRLIKISNISRATNIENIFENNFVTVLLRNNDNYFNYDKIKYSTENELTIYKDSTLIFTGKISGFPSNDGKIFSVTADVNSGRLSADLGWKITADEFSPLWPSSDGKYGNILCGTFYAEKGCCKAIKFHDATFIAAAHHLKSITGVWNPQGGVCGWTLDNNADGRCYLTGCTNVSDNEEIYFNCTGMMDVSGNLITNPAEALEAINQLTGNSIHPALTFSGLAEAETYYEEKGYQIAIGITEKMNWLDFFQKFNFDCTFYPKADGSIGLKAFDFGSEVATTTLTDSQIYNFKQNMKVEDVWSWYTKKYNYNYALGEYADIPQSVPDQFTGDYWKGITEDIEMPFVYGSTTANAISSRIHFLKSRPLICYNFDVEEEAGDAYELADITTITYASGLYSDEPRDVMILRKSSGVEGFVNLECLDITSVNAGLIILRSGDLRHVLRDTDDERCGRLM